MLSGSGGRTFSVIPSEPSVSEATRDQREAICLKQGEGRSEELLRLCDVRTHTGLYIGVTSDLQRRFYEHKNKLLGGFTSKYSLDRLVYFEEGEDVLSAIEREKQLKSWRRAKKVALIESANPQWRDLSLEWDLKRP